jgi:thymidylate kinase
MNKSIIALTGLAESGKDTVADMMVDELENAIVVALADTPKQMAAKHFNIPINYFYDRDLKDTSYNNGPSPRHLLVTWFDELFNEHGPSYSLEMNIKRIQSMDKDWVIISDIRYPIEFDWVSTENIPLFNIHRNNIQKTIDHHTETSSNDGVVINNNGSLENLRNNVKTAVQNIFKC